MLAVRLNPDTANVVGFELATLRQFQLNPKYTTHWRFVDRCDFWEPNEISDFMIKPGSFFYDDTTRHLVKDITI